MDHGLVLQEVLDFRNFCICSIFHPFEVCIVCTHKFIKGIIGGAHADQRKNDFVMAVAEGLIGHNSIFTDWFVRAAAEGLVGHNGIFRALFRPVFVGLNGIFRDWFVAVFVGLNGIFRATKPKRLLFLSCFIAEYKYSKSFVCCFGVCPGPAAALSPGLSINWPCSDVNPCTQKSAIGRRKNQR